MYSRNVCKLWLKFQLKGSPAPTERMQLNVTQWVTISKNYPRVFLKFWLDYFLNTLCIFGAKIFRSLIDLQLSRSTASSLCQNFNKMPQRSNLCCLRLLEKFRCIGKKAYGKMQRFWMILWHLIFLTRWDLTKSTLTLSSASSNSFCFQSEQFVGSPKFLISCWLLGQVQLGKLKIRPIVTGCLSKSVRN